MARRALRAAMIAAASSLALVGFAAFAPDARADGDGDADGPPQDASVEQKMRDAMERAQKAEQEAKRLLESGRAGDRVAAARLMQRAWHIREELWTRAEGAGPGGRAGGDAADLMRRVEELKRVSTDAEKMGHALREAGKPEDAEAKMQESGRLWKEAEAIERKVKEMAAASRSGTDGDRPYEIEARMHELRKRSEAAEREAHELRDAGKADAAEQKIAEATALWKSAEQLKARLAGAGATKGDENREGDAKDAAERAAAETKAQQARAEAEKARMGAEVAAKAARESQIKAQFAQMEAMRKAHEAKAADQWAAGNERAAKAEMDQADRIGQAMREMKARLAPGGAGAPGKPDREGKERQGRDARDERKKERRELLLSRDGKLENATVVVDPSGEKHVVVVEPAVKKQVIVSRADAPHVVVLDDGRLSVVDGSGKPVSDDDAARRAKAQRDAIAKLLFGDTAAATDKAEKARASATDAEREMASRRQRISEIERLVKAYEAEAAELRGAGKPDAAEKHATKAAALREEAQKLRESLGVRAPEDGIGSLTQDVRRMQAELKQLRGMIESLVRSLKERAQNDK